MPELPVVVIGGGLAGLTAAARAARSGARVLLMEQSRRLGGRARSSERERHVLNLGPHGLALDGPGTRILNELGVDLPGRSPQPHRTRFLVDGRLVHPLVRRDGGLGLRGLAGMQRLASRAVHLDPAVSIRDWVDAVVGGQERAIALALARLTTYTDDPGRQAADLAVPGFLRPVRYLDGGWQSLVTGLAAIAAAAGAEIRPGAAVRGVTRDAGTGAFTVRAADGTATRAAAVVLAAGGPAQAVRILGDLAGEGLREAAGSRPPVTMASLDLALAHRPPLPSLILGVDEPLYLSVQSDRSRIAPPGGAVVQLARFLPVGGTAPAGREQLERVMDDHAPGWREQLVHARYLPNLTVAHDACLTATGGRRGRITAGAAGTPGVSLAGDWVGPVGALAQASIASGAEAAELALTHRRQS